MTYNVNETYRAAASATVKTTTANVVATGAARVLGWYMQGTATTASLIIANATTLATNGTAPLTITALGLTAGEAKFEWVGQPGIRFGTGLAFRTDSTDTLGIVFYAAD